MRAPEVPREHGFWVMLVAVVAAAVARNAGTPSAWVAAGLVLAVMPVAGGSIRRRVRRAPAWQLGATALLATSGVPVGLAAGEPLADVLRTTATWAAVLVTGSLVVRSVLARSDRARRSTAWAALTLSAASAIGFAAVSDLRSAIAAGGAAAFATIVIRRHPAPRELPRVGLCLGALATVTAVLLSA